MTGDLTIMTAYLRSVRCEASVIALMGGVMAG